eukprot:TRINITY_DN4331_c0_g1_i2.p1 TRINITY_DN4331_c0_g1~~TRINITY_DN4331_c0_g1_i2.p1  ORF type:complete len:162 (+),score=35.17 TRINITY_DN4331_c0_g1_i2:69-554(+)
MAQSGMRSLWRLSQLERTRMTIAFTDQAAALSFSLPRLMATTVEAEIGEVSGVPDEHLQRKVIIYQPARTASQQSAAKKSWKIRFESTKKWENPLMGWTSTADPLSSVGESSLSFDSKDSAVDFARRYGWQFSVQEPKNMKQRVKAYADNFKWKGPAATTQ